MCFPSAGCSPQVRKMLKVLSHHYLRMSLPTTDCSQTGCCTVACTLQTVAQGDHTAHHDMQETRVQAGFAAPCKSFKAQSFAFAGLKQERKILMAVRPCHEQVNVTLHYRL